jgi:hypothetical protein
MVSTLAKRSPGREPAAVDSGLDRLRALMDQPLPDASKVAGLAGEAAQALERWLGRVRHEPFDPPKAELLLGTLRAMERNRVEPSGPGWDLEAQVYLGLVPLRQSLGEPSRNDPSLLNELRDRRKRLLAPFVPVRSETLGALRPLDGPPGH